MITLYSFRKLVPYTIKAVNTCVITYFLQFDVAKSELEIYSTQQDGLKNQEKEAKENLENGKEKLKDLKRFTCYKTNF